MFAHSWPQLWSTQTIEPRTFQIASSYRLQIRQTVYGMCCSRYRTLRLIYKKSRSEAHTSELQSLMRISYAVFCLKKKKKKHQSNHKSTTYKRGIQKT